MVLDFPQVALEVEAEPTPVGEFHLELIERREQWRIRLAVERLRADQVRERAVDLAAGSTRCEPCTGRFPPRVVDAEADAAERERSPGAPVEDVLDATCGRPGDRAVPGEVDLAACMADIELDAEAVSRLLDLQPGDDAGNGVPVDVAHRRIDAANELGAADLEVAQVDPVEQHGGRARAQETHVREGRVRPVEEPQPVGGERHPRPPSISPQVTANRFSFAVNNGFSSTSGLATFAGWRPAATESSAAHASSTQPRIRSSV